MVEPYGSGEPPHARSTQSISRRLATMPAPVKKRTLSRLLRIYEWRGSLSAQEKPGKIRADEALHSPQEGV